MNRLWARLRAVIARPQEAPAARDEDVEEFTPIIRQGMIVVALFFGVLGAWAVFGKISGAVVVPGTIKIDTERKTVQHLEGGIIDAIHVREGEQVVKGQPLITLRNATVDSSVDKARKNLILFLAAKDRFQAEKALFQPIEWDKELLALVEEYGSDEVLRSERKIFDARRASYESQARLLDAQIRQITEQIQGMREELNAEKAILATLGEELAAKRTLVAKNTWRNRRSWSWSASSPRTKGRRGAFGSPWLPQNRKRAAFCCVRRRSP